MLQRFLRGNTDNIKIVSKILLRILLCFMTLAVMMSLSAFIICKTDFTYESLPTVIAFILGISSLFDGFVISKSEKENGLFWGVFAGIVILMFIIIISVCQKTFNINTNFIIRSAITVIAGAIGGIAGVNAN